MKVRVCPNCGKHNNEYAFNCVDCGTTLSIDTIADTDTGQFPKIKPIAGLTQLAKISPFFEGYIVKEIRKAPNAEANILWGCNITHVTDCPPFVFGYLLVYPQRLICTYFESEIELRSGRPSRPSIVFFDRVQRATLAVNYPDYALTPYEEESRVDVIYDVGNLHSFSLVHKWFGEKLVERIVIRQSIPKFQGAKETILRETAIDFYSPEHAEKVCELITAK